MTDLAAPRRRWTLEESEEPEQDDNDDDSADDVENGIHDHSLLAAPLKQKACHPIKQEERRRRAILRTACASAADHAPEARWVNQPGHLFATVLAWAPAA
jgi:hypothetical protein